MSDLSSLSHIITEQAARIRELEAQILAERKCLRDEFAVAALGTVPYYADLSLWEPQHFSLHAYLIADAMMERRK